MKHVQMEKINRIFEGVKIEIEREETEKEKFQEISTEEVSEILELTVKQDKINKIITFLACLSAYTEGSQLNISFNAPSSTGKSFIPLEIVSLFPVEDVIKTAYCSPTAFFHDRGKFDKAEEGFIVDLERKILVFLDQPHTQLLQHLRPLLSHDEKEIKIKITDKNQKFGLRTKNVLIKGFPVVIFCSAGLKIDEQEATRFLLLSPETNQEKLRKSICHCIEKETDPEAYFSKLNDNPERKYLMERILAIKSLGIKEIKIADPETIQNEFFSRNSHLNPRHQRDIKRLISLIKAIALLNPWHRNLNNKTITVSDKDIYKGFELWDQVYKSQEYNLPPYIYQVYEEVIISLYIEKGNNEGLEKNEILQNYLKVYNRPLAEWQLRREIIPMLESAGLIIRERDPEDKRKILIKPVH